jgi:predicted AAA+ superfamily ATPase
MLAHYNGGIWNAHTFADSLGVTAPTVRRYLDYMEGAFLIRRLNPWFINAKKRLVKSPKIYIRDSGLLHALLNIDNLNELYGNPYVGNSWESFVIEQIIGMLPDNLHPFYYRTHHGAEADLVLVKGINPVAVIEIKLSNAPEISKGFYHCISDLKAKDSFIITPQSDDYSVNNIHICSLIKFLKNHLPKIIKNKPK